MRRKSLAESILYKHLTGIPAVVSGISGEIYRGTHDSESKQEDIVINSIAAGEGSLQIVQANVNVYVPDIQADFGKNKRKVKNHIRLDTIADLLVGNLKGHGPDYHFRIIGQGDIEEPETDTHGLNFRIEFVFFNS